MANTVHCREFLQNISIHVATYGLTIVNPQETGSVTVTVTGADSDP